MTNFDLSIQFTQSDTAQINSEGFVVAIVKGTFTPGTPILLWTALAPFEQNSVTWESIYGVYASPDPIQLETVITASSTLYPANPGVIYPFVNNVFGSPIGIAQPNFYAIENKVSETLTFGLAQTVTANGSVFNASPVNARAVSTQEIFGQAPVEILSVFLYRETTYGTIIVVTEGPVLVVDIAANPTQTIHYNGSEFVPGPLT